MKSIILFTIFLSFTALAQKRAPASINDVQSFQDFKGFHQAVIEILIKQEQETNYPLKLILEGQGIRETSFFFFKLINSAHAEAQGKLCFFGGWPSLQTNSYCRVPWQYTGDKQLKGMGALYTPDLYCGAKNLFRCNPTLFGGGKKGICVTIDSYQDVTKKCYEKTRKKVKDLYLKYKKDPQFRRNYTKLTAKIISFCEEKPRYKACLYLKKNINDFYQAVCQSYLPKIGLKTIKKTNNDIRAIAQEIKKKDKKKKRRKKKVRSKKFKRKIQRRFEKHNNRKNIKGFMPELVAPLKGEACRVTSSYQKARRLRGSSRSVPHVGVDISAPKGSPVLAIAKGRIVFSYSSCSDEGLRSRCNYGYGNQVFIEHKTDREVWYSSYLHLTKSSVSPGQMIKAGEKIGTVGTTGYVTGPHLHIEIMNKRQIRSNPKLYFKEGKICD